MSVNLIPSTDVPILAAHIDSGAMLRVLHYLRKEGFVLNGASVTRATLTVLDRLAGLGLVDVGHEGSGSHATEPALWVANANGSRVLRHVENSPVLRAELETNPRIHPRARTALSAISDWEQAQVLAVAAAFQREGPSFFPGRDVLPLGADGKAFLLKVPPDLRAFVRPDAGGVELTDLVREPALRHFEPQPSPTGAGR